MIQLVGGTLHQWGVDRKIKIVNKNIAKVSFSNNHYGECERFDVVDGMVTIPDKFLESNHDLFVYGIDRNGREIYSCELAVNSKMKPEGYPESDKNFGLEGQFAVSDGKGGFNWITLEVASEVTF